MKKISIYHFTDFSLFFSAVIADRKKHHRGFSLRKLASQLKFKSHSHFAEIAHGKRLASAEFLEKISAYLGFNPEEYIYAKYLLQLQGSKDPLQRQFFLEKIDEMRNDDTEYVLKEDVLSFISHWYYVAILEMVDLPDFCGDSKLIRKRLMGSVSSEEVKTAIEVLIRLRLLQKTDAGKLKRTADSFASIHNITNASLRNFHRQMLKNAEDAMDSLPTDQRYMLGQTFPMDSKNLKAAETLLLEFKTRFQKLVSSHKSDQVYHLAMQFFPLTKSVSLNK